MRVGSEELREERREWRVKSEEESVEREVWREKMEEREVEEDEKGGEKCEWVLLEYCAAPSAFEDPQGRE